MIGFPLALTPADLDLAAMVTSVDVALGRAFWYRHAPARYLDLLDAMRRA